MLSIFTCVCWPSVWLLWRNICLGLLPIFKIGLFVSLLLRGVSCLNILEIKPLLVASFANIFSESVRGLWEYFLRVCMWTVGIFSPSLYVDCGNIFSESISGLLVFFMASFTVKLKSLIGYPCLSLLLFLP